MTEEQVKKQNAREKEVGEKVYDVKGNLINSIANHRRIGILEYIYEYEWKQGFFWQMMKQQTVEGIVGGFVALATGIVKILIPILILLTLPVSIPLLLIYRAKWALNHAKKKHYLSDYKVK